MLYVITMFFKPHSSRLIYSVAVPYLIDSCVYATYNHTSPHFASS